MLLASEHLADQFQQQADFEIQPLEFAGVGESRRIIAVIAGMNVQREQGAEYGEVGALQFPQFDFIRQGGQFAPGQRQAPGEDQARGGGVCGREGHGGNDGCR